MGQKVGSRDARLKSKGCLTCIRMKVKCDETKPQCQRCQKRRRECPGYRDSNAFVFRLEAQGTNTTCQGSSLKGRDESLTMPSSPSADWVQCAVSHFFYNFVIPSKHGLPGYFEFLPQLYGADPVSPCLRHAIKAIAIAHLSNVQNMGEAYLRKARRSYGYALHQLGLALNDSDKASSPAVLATVTLLWKYDIIMGEDNLQPNNPHSQGQLELLRLRLSQEAESDMWINRPVLAIVQMQQIDPSTLPYNNLLSAIDASSSQPIEPSMMLQEALLPKTTFLCAVVSSLIQKKPSIADVAKYSGELQDLRKQLKAWEDMMPTPWRYKTFSNPLATSEDPFPQTVIILPGMATAGIWLAFWLARLSVLRNMISLLSFELNCEISRPPMPEIRGEMQSISNCICSSISYMLGQVTPEGDGNIQGDAPAIGAFFATRSLYTCAQIPDLPVKQVEWILSRLSYIGHEKGIRKALLLRDEILQTRAATASSPPTLILRDQWNLSLRPAAIESLEPTSGDLARFRSRGFSQHNGLHDTSWTRVLRIFSSKILKFIEPLFPLSFLLFVIKSVLHQCNPAFSHELAGDAHDHMQQNMARTKPITTPKPTNLLGTSLSFKSSLRRISAHPPHLLPRP